MIRCLHTNNDGRILYGRTSSSALHVFDPCGDTSLWWQRTYHLQRGILSVPRECHLSKWNLLSRNVVLATMRMLAISQATSVPPQWVFNGRCSAKASNMKLNFVLFPSFAKTIWIAYVDVYWHNIRIYWLASGLKENNERFYLNTTFFCCSSERAVHVMVSSMMLPSKENWFSAKWRNQDPSTFFSVKLRHPSLCHTWCFPWPRVQSSRSTVNRNHCNVIYKYNTN